MGQDVLVWVMMRYHGFGWDKMSYNDGVKREGVVGRSVMGRECCHVMEESAVWWGDMSWGGLGVLSCDGAKWGVVGRYVMGRAGSAVM